MSPLPMGESRFTSSGSLTLISSPTTATTDPRTGPFVDACLQTHSLQIRFLPFGSNLFCIVCFQICTDSHSLHPGASKRQASQCAALLPVWVQGVPPLALYVDFLTTIGQRA